MLTFLNSQSIKDYIRVLSARKFWPMRRWYFNQTLLACNFRVCSHWADF